MYTYYEYDANGNKTFEGYISLKNPVTVTSGAEDYYQYANISYEYDAASNRRMVKSIYHDGINGAQRVQEYWYQYDQMNRFTITMGSLALTAGGVATSTRGASAADTTITINKGAAGGAGVAISYNMAGERVQAVNAIDGTTEAYTYTADGYLANVNINGVLRSSRVNDALGRTTGLTQYNSKVGCTLYLIENYALNDCFKSTSLISPALKLLPVSIAVMVTLAGENSSGSIW